MPTVSVDSKTVKAGDEFSINIRVEHNPGIIAMQVLAEYDRDAFELISAVGADFAGVAFGQLDANPFAVNWVDSIHPNNTTDGVLATLTFRVKEDAKAGPHTISLSYDEDNIHDYNFNNVEFAVEAGTVIVQCREHSYGSFAPSTETEHSKTCSVCVHTVTAAHDYDNAIDGECNVCGHEREITFTGWISISGKWAYYENGAKHTCRWKKDSVGWVYLGADGYMLTNAWVQDSVGWCYVGANGYCVTNCWKKDSVGWCYLNNEGRMATNAWVRDSVGWCYVGANGYAVTNCWKKDSVGWCYLNANGSMTKNAWVLDGGKWYYCDGNGYMVTGRRLIGGKYYTFNSSGVWVA